MGMLTIRVTPEQHRKVKAAAMMAGVSMEAYCRDAIAQSMRSEQGRYTRDRCSREVYFDKKKQQWAVRFNDEASTVVFHESKSVIEDLLAWVDNRGIKQRGHANGKGR